MSERIPPSPTTAIDEAAPVTAEELASSIRELLDQQQLRKACQTAARAARDYPEHPWLAQADRVLNPDVITPRPATGRGRARELAWLRRNAETYRGRWVALHGDELVASGETFQDVEHGIRQRDLDGKPLIHYVA